RERECHAHRAACEPRGAALAEPIPEQQVQQHGAERQRGNDPERRHAVDQPLSRFTSSTNTVSRRRNRLTMIASPTATSAAATVITKNTKICPSSEFMLRANATNARFAAFSIS